MHPLRTHRCLSQPPCRALWAHSSGRIREPGARRSADQLAQCPR
ncbi:putative protein without homology [Propionibacterium freudenreichii subsp. shermanii]|nr:putative protein without homology [Propionibacterium freudenreichii subsp. shermanii]